MRYIELFAGVGGMSQGLHAAGMTPAALVEWDRAAAGVIAHHWPDVPLFADVQGFTGAEVRGPVDVLAFGSPCQDLSVAGKRKGLSKDSGTRSSLFHHAIRIANHLRLHNGLRYLLWENVVGALSSSQGADFAAVLGEMADLGARDIAWRVLDAQWFGVPQRRRRVFVVCDLGGERASQILSLAQGLRRDSPPSREAGQKPTGTLSARTQGGGGLGTDFEVGGGLVAGAVCAKWAKGTGGPAGDECQNLVAHTLRGEGFDASEDGTGRGTPLVPVAFHPTQDPISSSDISHALGCGSKGGQASFAVAFAENSRAELRLESGHGQVVGSLSTGGGKPGQGRPTVAINFERRMVRTTGGQPQEELCHSLKASAGGGDGSPCVASPHSGVRRLTPRECERLMGWPDDWTQHSQPLRKEGNRWASEDKPAKTQADGPRYKQCGNGVVASVAAWIGRNLVSAA
jgi:DNA (cytosine-5)-methyltransferase 1